MSDTELSDLNKWIAEHVMGWKWMRFDAPAVAANSGKKRDRWCQLVPPFEEWYHQPELRGVICNCAIEGMPDWTDLSVFKPSIDSAAAMQVLEKCIQCKGENTSSIRLDQIGLDGKLEFMITFVNSEEIEILTTAPTLPLAIALFSKQLFSK